MFDQIRATMIVIVHKKYIKTPNKKYYEMRSDGFW